jgi:uncharacterized oxidoreductase
MPTFAAADLEQLASQLLQGAGTPPELAAIVADHLIEANLAGHDSHGVLRVLQYVDFIENGHIQPAGHARVLERFTAGAVIDGCHGLGQVIGREATLLAIEIAQESGIGGVTVRNCHHTGRIGTYTLSIAEAGMIGMCFVNSGGGAQAVPPFGGLKRRLSTNPISISAPQTDGPPLVLDMATTVAPEGKVRAKFQAGKPAPDGWLVDAEGRPTNDASQLYADPPGALVPLGGPVAYKGYCLALMIDILAGVLTGAGGCAPDRAYPGDGLFVMAIDVAKFQPLADFSQRVRDLAQYMQATPTMPGVDRVLVPGEIELQRKAARLRDGVYVEDGTWNLLLALCEKFAVKPPAAKE